MAAIWFGKVRLSLPALVYINGYLSADEEIGLRAAGINFLSAEVMVCKEYFRSEIPGWIVDLDGCFREFSPTGKRRSWARPLRFLWRFTLSEYRATLPRTITVGELREKIRGIKADREVVAHLKNYLEQLRAEEPITQDVLRKWPI
ncbi:hypothetical protein [Lysobacter solisilvae (ex Woo and Kim 2020)]|uniref:Uncharacterized protein n=1 Tax=Agrilutibacter terrestris TaxID=2865112 RepID=A0A7H0FWN3_9GAMM|nr:hypothetical protein [Lysobacter terrestris]QNP40449.1 hypothetical protein H8B22_13385 [Lysobacter terrestris]